MTQYRRQASSVTVRRSVSGARGRCESKAVGQPSSCTVLPPTLVGWAGSIVALIRFGPRELGSACASAERRWPMYALISGAPATARRREGRGGSPGTCGPRAGGHRSRKSGGRMGYERSLDLRPGAPPRSSLTDTSGSTSAEIKCMSLTPTRQTPVPRWMRKLARRHLRIESSLLCQGVVAICDVSGPCREWRVWALRVRSRGVMGHARMVEGARRAENASVDGGEGVIGGDRVDLGALRVASERSPLARSRRRTALRASLLGAVSADADHWDWALWRSARLLAGGAGVVRSRLGRVR